VIEAANRRVVAGASPESVRLTAEAAKARAEFERARAKRERDAKVRQMSLLWTTQDPGDMQVTGELLKLPEIRDLRSLTDLLSRSPDLARFVDERRIREARLQLARAERTSDVTVSFGVRRLQEEGEWAAIAGVSMPLGTRGRAALSTRASQAELDALNFQEKGRELTLLATLTEAHTAFVGGKEEVEQISRVVLPALVKADQSSERAFRAGALGYLEWAQVQADVVAIRREQIAAAFRAHQALIEIQRLTGDPFLANASEKSQ
jgi:outer membrane protein, heavy metal efflux system